MGLLSLNFLTQLGILVNFSINQDYIAKVLCINKDKPQMQCNGKCHLAQQLQDTAPTEESENPANTTEQIEPPLFVVNAVVKAPDTPGNPSKQKNIGYYNNEYSFSWVNAHFHPPRQV